MREALLHDRLRSQGVCNGWAGRADGEWEMEERYINGEAGVQLPLPCSCCVIFASVKLLSSLQVRSTIKSCFSPCCWSLTDLWCLLRWDLPEPNSGLTTFHGFTCTAVPQSYTRPLDQCWFMTKASTRAHTQDFTSLKLGSARTCLICDRMEESHFQRYQGIRRKH